MIIGYDYMAIKLNVVYVLGLDPWEYYYEDFRCYNELGHYAINKNICKFHSVYN